MKDDLIVVFGRPGAGKSTISQAAVHLLCDGELDDEQISSGKLNHGDDFLLLYLDLDVCVPQWMRDNFSKGIYPTLVERYEFISNACDYVTDKISSAHNMSQFDDKKSLITIVSFSFVNTDMRVEFSNRFPHAEWILVDTDKDLAEERILLRQDHFYKGCSGVTSNIDAVKEDHYSNAATKLKESSVDSDNSQWDFQPINFPHTILDGSDDVAANAKKIVDVILIQLST